MTKNNTRIILLCLLLSSINTVSFSFPLRASFYVEAGLGTTLISSGGQQSEQTIFQRPNRVAPLLLVNKNSIPDHSLNVHIGLGYLLPFTDAFSLSIGSELSQFKIKNHGEAVLAGNKNPYYYSYMTKVNKLSIVTRIYYTISRWHYFAGVAAGLAQLSSVGYHSNYSNSSGKKDFNANNNKQALSVGEQVGVLRSLKHNVELGVQLGYQNDGTSQLGAKKTWGSNNPPEGRISQDIRLLNATLLLEYYF